MREGIILLAGAVASAIVFVFLRKKEKNMAIKSSNPLMLPGAAAPKYYVTLTK